MKKILRNAKKNDMIKKIMDIQKIFKNMPSYKKAHVLCTQRSIWDEILYWY